MYFIRVGVICVVLLVFVGVLSMVVLFEESVLRSVGRVLLMGSDCM